MCKVGGGVLEERMGAAAGGGDISLLHKVSWVWIGKCEGVDVSM